MTLHGNEYSPESLNLLRETQQFIRVCTLVLGVSMFESAVNLTPSRLASAGGGHAYKHIGTATRKRMKQGIVGSTYGAAQFRLNRPSYPASKSAGRQVLGDPYQVIRVQESLLPYTSSHSDFSTNDLLGRLSTPSSSSSGIMSPTNPNDHPGSMSLPSPS